MQRWVRCQCTRCDDIDPVGAMSDTGTVLSCLKWMCHLKYCGLVRQSVCIVIYSAKDVIHMPRDASSTQSVVMSHLVDIMS